MAAVFGYGSVYQYQKYLAGQARINAIQKNLEKFEPVTLKGKDLQYYPWYTGKLADWEYKLVKIRGFFKEERFFVRREKEGKVGYLVLAPFVTALNDVDYRRGGNNPPVEHSVIVNLGWVPAEHLDDITMTSEPIPLLEQGQVKKEIDRYTGFRFNRRNPEDVYPLTDVVGIVRRGEQESILNRRRNWPLQGVYTWIDLHFIARFFKIFNDDSAETAYIERMVPSFEGEEESVYPIPATKNTYVQPLDTPNVNARYSSYFAGASVASLASLVALTRFI